MPTFNAPLPPTRSTGDAPPEGPAGDVNMLTVAVTEVRGEVPDPPDLSGYVTTVDAGATFVPLSDANPLLVGDGLALDQDAETGAVTLSTTATGAPLVSRGRIYKGDAQALTAGSNVTITLGSTEVIAGDAVEYVPNGIRALKAGTFLVGASVWSYTGSAGERSVAIRVNTTTVREFGGSAAGRFGFSDSIVLAVNDVVTLDIYSAVANGVQGFGTKDTGLTLTYLGVPA